MSLFYERQKIFSVSKLMSSRLIVYYRMIVAQLHAYVYVTCKKIRFDYYFYKVKFYTSMRQEQGKINHVDGQSIKIYLFTVAD